MVLGSLAINSEEIVLPLSVPPGRVWLGTRPDVWQAVFAGPDPLRSIATRDADPALPH